MNSQQAKEILLLYRPGVPEPDEPELAAALDLARQDPELKQWFEEHQAAHQVIRTGFREITVPEGLREQILSERKAHFSAPLRRKAIMALTVMALALILGAVLFDFLRPREDKTFTNFQNRMLRMAARLYPKMDLETDDPRQIRNFLSQHQAHANYILPAALDRTAPTGCALLRWQDKPVSMVCFRSATNSTANADLFLFIISRSDVPKAPTAAVPTFSQTNQMATASWSDKENTYVLAGWVDEPSLRKLS